MNEKPPWAPWGTFTNEQVAAHLNRSLPGLRCPLCDSRDFQIESFTHQDGDAYKPYHVVGWHTEFLFGLVLLTCVKCAHVLFFSAPALARQINGSKA